MPASAAAGHAAAAPLTFPLVMADASTGRVFTTFQLPTAPWHLGSPTYRTVTKTNISSWTF